jgi:hypothetical protein
VPHGIAPPANGKSLLSSSAQRPPRRSTPYALLAVGLSLVVYAPILKNYFWQDDFLILHLLTNWPLGRFLTARSGGHLLIVRNAFYAGMYAVAGTNPMPYYLVLLALHGINVGLVFAIVHIVTRSAPLACLAATAWGTCLINEGALGWIAASGNVMVATTTLVVLLDVVRSAWRQTRVGLARAALWAVLLLAGAQSFGTGLGVAVGAPIVLAWLAWDRLTRAARAVLLALPVVTPWMYGGKRLTEQLASSGLASAEMLFHLQAIGVTTLIRGFGHKPGVLDLVPWSSASLTVSVIAALVICLWAVAAGRWSTGRTRRLLITVAVLALCNYGSVALGRAPLVEGRTQSLLRWAGQARYHYSATALLAIGLAVVLASVFSKGLTAWPRAALLAWVAVFAILYAQTGWTIRHYDGERHRVAHVLARIDAAISATPAGEPVVTYNEPFLDGPHLAGTASVYVMNRYKFDREVYFIDPAAVAIYSRFPGSPLAHALLPPPPATGHACPRFTLQSEVPDTASRRWFSPIQR